VQSFAFRAILVVACLSTITIDARGPDAPSTGQHVAALAYSDSPLTVVPEPILSSQTPQVVRFTVTNEAETPICDYDVRVFAFRSNGRPLGFKSTRQHASLSQGAQHAALVSLPERITLELGACLLITVMAVAFEDGSRWGAAEDVIDRAKSEALRLTRTGASER
jgi:hypothetical protein